MNDHRRSPRRSAPTRRFLWADRSAARTAKGSRKARTAPMRHFLWADRSAARTAKGSRKARTAPMQHFLWADRSAARTAKGSRKARTAPMQHFLWADRSAARTAKRSRKARTAPMQHFLWADRSAARTAKGSRKARTHLGDAERGAQELQRGVVDADERDPEAAHRGRTHHVAYQRLPLSVAAGELDGDARVLRDLLADHQQHPRARDVFDRAEALFSPVDPVPDADGDLHPLRAAAIRLAHAVTPSSTARSVRTLRASSSSSPGVS